MSNDMSNDMSYESPSAAIMKTTTPYTSVLYNMNSIAFTRMTTVFDDRTGNNDLDLYFYTVFDGCTGNNDGISSAAIADKAQYDCYDGDTAVSRASPSIVIDTESSTVSVASNKAPSTGNDSLATVTLRTYDTEHNLYFEITLNTAFNTAIDTTFISASHASSSYDIDTDSSAVSVADEATFATVTLIFTDILTSSESSAVSIPTQLPINIFEPCFTCFCFYLRGLLRRIYYFLRTSVTMISDIIPRLLLLLIPMQYYTSFHSRVNDFEVNFVPSLLSLLTFYETIYSHPYFDTISC